MSRDLSLVVDMYGCPNRCKHCWLGSIPHQQMEQGTDQWIVDYFKPYFDTVEYYSWLREPDNLPDYEARWERDKAISVGVLPERFELASFLRLSHDPEYAKFLKRVGVECVQLTFFGLEETTDRYVGRKGAFGELLQATENLFANGIAPRYQAFINRENKDEVVKLLDLIRDLQLEERCKAIGKEFMFLVHEGSCSGENSKLYDIRISKNEIPNELIPYYHGYGNLLTERECCERLKDEAAAYVYHNEDRVVLHITSNYDVYYNFTHISPNWRIGNLKEEAAEVLVPRILDEDSFALRMARDVTLSELVERYGDFSSDKVFSLGDYKEYLLNRHIDNLPWYHI